MAAAQPPALFPAKLPLLRPKHGRWIAGVARGIGMHLGVHVAWVRLAFALSCFAYGAGAIAYVALWVLVPPGDPVAEAARRVRLAQSAGAANAPLSRGNTPYGTPRSPEPVPDNPYDYTGLNEEASGRPVSMESMRQVIDEASKPALFACAGVVLIAIALLINQLQTANGLMLPVLLAATGVGLPWLRFNARTGQTWTTVVGVLLVFAAYALLVTQTTIEDGSVPFLYSLCAGFALLAGVLCALVPQLVSLMRTSGRERALKEREEERADMAAHLHDGVLQTLALIQLHAAEPQQVFALARSQERELRSWLYQERTTSDRSVKAGLEEIAAQIEDTHGKPIDVVTVGDARPSAQTDALLDAAAQAMVNAVTHGGEPVSVYCEAGERQVEVFVRDHGEGFDVDAIPEGRLGIRESIMGRVRRRGGTVEIVSRPHWGTEVRMHMPIVAGTSAAQTAAPAKPSAGAEDHGAAGGGAL